MKKLIFLLLFLQSNLVFAEHIGQSFDKCYAALNTLNSTYFIPDKPPRCIDDNRGNGVGRVVLQATDFWRSNDYLEFNSWWYNNRDTTGCNQTQTNVSTSVDVTNPSQPTASRDGGPPKGVSVGKTGSVILGKVGGALRAASSLLLTGTLEVLKSLPAVQGQNCSISTVNNNVTNQTVTTSDITAADIQQILQQMNAQDFEVMMNELNAAEFDCVTGGSCDGILPEEPPPPSPPDFNTSSDGQCLSGRLKDGSGGCSVSKTTKLDGTVEETVSKDKPAIDCADAANKDKLICLDVGQPASASAIVQKNVVSDFIKKMSNGGSCPAPIVVQTKKVGTVTLTYQPLCDFAILINPFVLAMFGVAAVKVVFSVVRV